MVETKPLLSLFFVVQIFEIVSDFEIRISDLGACDVGAA